MSFIDGHNRLIESRTTANVLLGSYVYNERGLRIKAERMSQPMVQVVEPNGGESLYLGAMNTVRWSGLGLAGGTAKLELLVDGAVAGTIAEGIPGGQTSFQWQAGKMLGGWASAGTNYKVRVTAVAPPAASGTTYYFYDSGGKLLAEYDGTGAFVKDYLYLGGKMIGEFVPSTGSNCYYASDQINSTRMVTDATGAVVHSAQYDPYGGLYKTWVDAYRPKPGFSGKEREFGSEMDYFGARYYGQNQYRFLSTDPIIGKEKAINNQQFWNSYSYCINNPINVIDPDGLDNYVFYDPMNFSSQAKAEAMQLKASNNEMTHMVPVSSTSEFAENWNSMNDPTNVTLLFHSGSGDARMNTISIAAASKQYLTTNKSGTTPKGRPAMYIGSLTKFSIDTIKLYICHSAEGNNSMAETFFTTQHVGMVTGAEGSVNYNWITRHPKQSTKWVSYIRSIDWIKIGN